MRPFVVLLAGGGGTRLWPASRRACPKHLLPLAEGGKTLLAATFDRACQVVPQDRIIVVTSAEQQESVRSALGIKPGVDDEDKTIPGGKAGMGTIPGKEYGAEIIPGREEVGWGQVVVEPAARSTTAAIALAAHTLLERGCDDAVLGVLPSDHLVADVEAFRSTLQIAFRLAETHLVTIGIRPNRPETGFGYLELGAPIDGGYEVARFVEKPDLATAERYVNDGHHLWNSGMFFFRATHILAEIERLQPDVAHAVKTRYEAAPAVSIDYGIMEKTTGIVAVPGDFGWNDLGSWDSIAEISTANANGTYRQGGPLVEIDAHGNIAVGKPLIALLGVDNLVVIGTDDAILVVPRDRVQEVRDITRMLERDDLTKYR